MTVQDSKKASKLRHLWRLLALMAGVLLALAGSGIYLLSTGMTAPDWMRAALEQRLNASIPNGTLHIGAIRLAPIDGEMSPTVSLIGVELRDAKGRIRAALPNVTGRFDGLEMLRGHLRPVNVKLRDARILLSRDADGRFDVSVTNNDNGDPGVLAESGNFGALMQSFEDLFSIPLLSSLKTVESTGSRVFLDDHLSGRTWAFRDGMVRVENDATSLSASATLKLLNVAAEDASATFGWHKEKGAQTSEFSIRFSGLRTEDVANQVAIFDWLRLLKAPIGGAMTVDVLADGSFGRMHGVLDLGAGRIRQAPDSKPVRFSGAKAYLSFDPEKEKFTFDQITVDTEAASLTIDGQAYLGDRIDRTVGALIGQFRFSQVKLDPAGVFAAPIEIESAAIDVRIRTQPLIVDIGQMVLVDKTARFVVKGQISAGSLGWTSALDLQVKSLDSRRLIALWPLVFKPKTRLWLGQNILAGRLENVTGALRATPGQPPSITLGFDLIGAAVRFMKTMPPIEHAVGYGVLGNNALHINVQQGTITAPDGGEVNLAGSSFHVTDTRQKNAPAQVDLVTQSSVQSLLSVLDLKPFLFLSKAGLGTDIATGTVSTSGKISFPLSGKVTFDQVALEMNGTLNRVRSGKLIKGKVLQANALSAFVDNSGLTISGSGMLGVVPVSGLWRQDFGPSHKGKSTIEGQIELSQKFLDEFGIKLPEGAVKGRGIGHITVDLARAKAPRFHLISDLNRMDLSLAAVGWSKPKNQKGTLKASGRFGTPAVIDQLYIKTKGLQADGSVKLKKDGSLDAATFTTVDVGGWLKAPVVIRPGANGNVEFDLNGGRLDLRKSRFSSPGGGPGQGNQIRARLDDLILSRGVILTDVQGNLSTEGGLTGSFSGKVNGGQPIKGTLAPQSGGTAVRFTSDDAGAVLRSAGIFDSGTGGRMDMILVPAGKTGVYNGRLKAKGTRVKNATSLADILSAISVVGLLEQLGGEGILFNTVDAKFRLTPNAIELQQSSAVGASLGLTMAGVYNFDTETMDMQGVITPIYLLNGVLEQAKIFGPLFGKEKGEGLFGFNYTLKGSVNGPKVGVNPLSILTPGLFREIFRRPIPKIGDAKKPKKAAPPATGNPDR